MPLCYKGNGTLSARWTGKRKSWPMVCQQKKWTKFSENNKKSSSSRGQEGSAEKVVLMHEMVTGGGGGGGFRRFGLLFLKEFCDVHVDM